MLAKCSNPSCANTLRYLPDGRLFRLENDPRLKASYLRTEYFWLCPACSQSLTLGISNEGEVVPVALADKGHVSNATITNHQKGMFLTNVSLFGRKEMARVRGSRLDEVSERVAR